MTPQLSVSRNVLSALKVAAFVAAVLPFALLIYGYYSETLSVNPLDDITDTTGTWTLRFLVITLAITPLRKITGWAQLARFRRMAGVFAFFYGTLHLFTYLYFDKFFEWNEILLDIPQRRFILVGFTAWTLMIPLAATSLNITTKWIGGKRWKVLHRLAYGIAVLGVVHYYWLVKFDTFRPLVYGAIVGALLLFRAGDWYYRRRKQRATAAPNG